MDNKESRARLCLLVEALRSGRYIQMDKFLGKKINGVEHNCAGGVAIRVAQANGLEIKVTHDEDGTIRFDDYAHYVLEKVWNWYGVNQHGVLPFKNRELVSQTIPGLNDAGLTFYQIADLIDHFWIGAEDPA